MYIDFTEKKLPCHVSIAGLDVQAAAFVAILEASGYTYAEIVVAKRQDDVLLCKHEEMAIPRYNSP